MGVLLRHIQSVGATGGLLGVLGGIHAAVASSAMSIQYIKCPSLHSVLDLVHDASVVGVRGRGVGVSRGSVSHGLRDALVVGRLSRSA